MPLSVVLNYASVVRFYGLVRRSLLDIQICDFFFDTNK